MNFILKMILCFVSAFIASLVVLDNSGIGTLGEWAGAAASFGAILIALKANAVTLSASFVYQKNALVVSGISVPNDLIMVVENKSNFDVQVDTMTVVFKTRFLRKNLGEFLIEQFNEKPVTIGAHKIYKSRAGFSVIGHTLPITNHKKILADAAVYYANKKTEIKVNELVYTEKIIAKRI